MKGLATKQLFKKIVGFEKNVDDKRKNKHEQISWKYRENE
ncbi:hypothetical protein C2W64_03931 [Brevibacillus laterosporus]|nr:hypothetical protein C2W64_03931 [Brevibacillus laterosporus]